MTKPFDEFGPDVIPATAVVRKKLEMLDGVRKTYKNLLKVCEDRDKANGVVAPPASATEPANVSDSPDDAE